MKTSATRKVSSLASWIAEKLWSQEASQEVKVKLNESRLLKFHQIKQLKENSTENSTEKNFKEDSQFNEIWNISKKKKKKKKKKEKRNYSNLKNVVSQTLSQISSCKLH